MRNRDWSDPWVKLIGAIAGALVVVVGALAAAGVFSDGTETKTVTEAVPVAAVPEATVVDGPDQDAKPDDVVELGPQAREVTADLIEEEGRYDAPDLEVDTGDELRGTDESGPVAVLQAPFAAEETPGCKTRFLTTNWSYRVPGARVIWITLHYTAGRDIPNSRADVDGLTAFGNNPASRVSWNYNLDKDGNCDYNVPIRYKSWAFGNANSWAVNIEVHGSGEAPYLRPAGYEQLARIYRYVHEAYPAVTLRLGSVNNCGPGSAGFVTHWMGGPCSGGHTDIRPLDINAVLAQLRQYAQPCGERCQLKKRLRTRLENRRERHERTHAAYQREGCRGRMHEVKLEQLKTEACRDIKRRGHRQHAGIRHTKARLKAA